MQLQQKDRQSLAAGWGFREVIVLKTSHMRMLEIAWKEFVPPIQYSEYYE